MELFPNTLSFRMVTSIDVASEAEIPAGFTGRVKKSVGGVVEYAAWYDRGKLEDPAPNTPAYVRYRRTGQPKQERHYRLGRRHDPAPGEPAVRGYYADGSVRYEEHFRYGRRHDAGDKAAITKWRLDGSLRCQLHYCEGVRYDLAQLTAGV